jgi:acyl-phosphate glycerol 3-phosphate acyltransferase
LTLAGRRSFGAWRPPTVDLANDADLRQSSGYNAWPDFALFFRGCSCLCLGLLLHFLLLCPSRRWQRHLGRKAGIAVALADIAKGFAAAWIGTYIANSVALSPLIMAAVVIGHIWPVQLGFRGGKGLAAGFGALLWLSPATAATAATVNVCLSLLVRSATLGSLTSTALVPLFAYIVGVGGWFALLLAIPCGLVLFAHRSDLRLAIAAKFPGAGPW